MPKEIVAFRRQENYGRNIDKPIVCGGIFTGRD